MVTMNQWLCLLAIGGLVVMAVVVAMTEKRR